jgi:hypothetical protein
MRRGTPLRGSSWGFQSSASRMGGAGNEFTFTNDIGFYNQHNIQRLPNGDLLLFDNGNQHTPPHSRAIQYIVDENAKTVTRYGM